MNFVAATLRESKRTVVINMSNVMIMIVRKLYNTKGNVVCGTCTDITLVNGDTLEVNESPVELINGVME